MSKNINIINCKTDWEINAIKFIKSKISNKKYVILSGGRSVTKLYKKNSFLKIIKNKDIIVSDERIDTHSANKNIDLIKNYFKNKLYLPEEFKKKYINKIDFSLLSYGDDGHVASIFPNMKKKDCLNKKNHFETKVKKFGFKRSSLLISTFRNIRINFIILIGKKKGLFFNKFKKKYLQHFKKKDLAKSFPVISILHNSFFLLDIKAYRELKK